MNLLLLLLFLAFIVTALLGNVTEVPAKDSDSSKSYVRSKDTERQILRQTLKLNLSSSNSQSEKSSIFKESSSNPDVVPPTSKDASHIETLIDEQFIRETIHQFQKDIELSNDTVNNVLNQAAILLAAEKNIVSVQVPSNGKLVIIGDLHGEFKDFLSILKFFEIIPKENLFFLFNGDFVDRGNEGFKILIVLLMLKICFPKYVFLNRGNHEDSQICSFHGFYYEMRDNGREAFFDMIVKNIFPALPIAHIINDQIFIVHGGISSMEKASSEERVSSTEIVSSEEVNSTVRVSSEEKISLDDFNTKFDRKLSIQVFKAFPERYEKVLCDFLWSDPSNDSAKFKAGNRGNSQIMFNSDATEEFLRENGLSLLIRSHEWCFSGYFLMHNDRCLTIHSHLKNVEWTKIDGSFAVFTPDSQLIEIFQFKSNFNDNDGYKYFDNVDLSCTCSSENITVRKDENGSESKICKCPIKLAKTFKIKDIETQQHQ